VSGLQQKKKNAPAVTAQQENNMVKDNVEFLNKDKARTMQLLIDFTENVKRDDVSNFIILGLKDKGDVPFMLLNINSEAVARMYMSVQLAGAYLLDAAAQGMEGVDHETYLQPEDEETEETDDEE
jgi:hypothetical protein